jgi:hypothetical protein
MKLDEVEVKRNGDIIQLIINGNTLEIKAKEFDECVKIKRELYKEPEGEARALLDYIFYKRCTLI